MMKMGARKLIPLLALFLLLIGAPTAYSFSRGAFPSGSNTASIAYLAESGTAESPSADAAQARPFQRLQKTEKIISLILIFLMVSSYAALILYETIKGRR